MIFLYAFLGGLILNFMPCVLPVVLIKLEGVLSNPEQASRHHILFSAGIMTVFAILGTAATFFGIAWGTQFQNEYFVNFIYIIALSMGLQLAGLFSWGISTKWFGGPYVSGIVATLLSTPCTGPFMALPLAWSATAGKFEGMGVFLSMGLGMCSPYIISTIFPAYKILPKPGPWMVYLKEMSGFVLLGAAIWILTFSANIPFLLALSLFLVILLKYLPKYKLASLILIIPILFYSNETKIETKWLNYSENLVEYFEATKQPYFIDFTADWCLICQSNKPKLELLKSKEKGIIFMRADYTDDDSEIESKLNEIGRNGLPVYLYWNGKDNIVENLDAGLK